MKFLLPLASLLSSAFVPSADGAAISPPKWFPSGGSGDWTTGYCKLSSSDYNGVHGPGYASNLDCCKGFYASQASGMCFSKMDSPPTSSPTLTGGGGSEYYPDYNSAWEVGTCKNELPVPSGSPVFSSMLACCKGAYASQASGACLAGLDSPPTTSPTGAGGADVYYPDYDSAWSVAGCKNDLPLPFAPGGRPTYASMLECCKGAYGGQASGACLAGMDSPPTTSPTVVGGLDVYYPDYDSTWSVAGCKNERPLPSGRPTYNSMLACCKGAYAGQTSGACLAGLDSPPTTSPTAVGGADMYYPDYDSAWSVAGCKNDLPLPFAPGGRPTYASMLECCKGAYSGQPSGACLAGLDSPPTTSPTAAGGPDAFYPDYSKAWSAGMCINALPVPSGRPLSDTKEECCAAHYASQAGDACMCDADPCYSCDCPGDLSACPSLVCD